MASNPARYSGFNITCDDLSYTDDEWEAPSGLQIGSFQCGEPLVKTNRMFGNRPARGLDGAVTPPQSHEVALQAPEEVP